MADDSELNGDDVGWWNCSLCTYKNSAEKFKCEICDLRRGTSTRKPRCSADTIVAQVVKQQEQIRQQTKAKPPSKTKAGGAGSQQQQSQNAATSHNDSMGTSGDGSSRRPKKSNSKRKIDARQSESPFDGTLDEPTLNGEMAASELPGIPDASAKSDAQKSKKKKIVPSEVSTAKKSKQSKKANSTNENPVYSELSEDSSDGTSSSSSSSSVRSFRRKKRISTSSSSSLSSSSSSSSAASSPSSESSRPSSRLGSITPSTDRSPPFHPASPEQTSPEPTTSSPPPNHRPSANLNGGAVHLTKDNPFKIRPIELNGSLIKYLPPTSTGRTGLIIDKKRFTQHSVTVDDVTITFTEFATRQNNYVRKSKKKSGKAVDRSSTATTKTQPKLSTSNNSSPLPTTAKAVDRNSDLANDP